MNMELHIRPSRLERRIRLLLHAYPPAYRADRGEEMLGTSPARPRSPCS
jgi:hypothetical protein